MSDNFLEPSDDTPVNVQNPEESMPGLAVIFVQSLTMQKMVVGFTKKDGYKLIKILEEYMILQHNIEIQNAPKFL